jgi:hypothetical protein
LIVIVVVFATANLGTTGQLGLLLVRYGRFWEGDGRAVFRDRFVVLVLGLEELDGRFWRRCCCFCRRFRERGLVRLLGGRVFVLFLIFFFRVLLLVLRVVFFFLVLVIIVLVLILIIVILVFVLVFVVLFYSRLTCFFYVILILILYQFCGSI